ncbi:hypothetical protein [Nitrospira sp. Kam-Ns4a]
MSWLAVCLALVVPVVLLLAVLAADRWVPIKVRTYGRKTAAVTRGASEGARRLP